MPLRKALFLFCIAAATFCLALGAGLAGQNLVMVLALLAGLAWLPAQKSAGTWLPMICLVASVLLSVSSLLGGAPAWLMISAAGLALAAWDLALLQKSIADQPPGQRFEKKHLQSLLWAIAGGLFVALAGRLFTLQLPFLVLFAVTILGIFGLERVWGYLKKRRAT